MVEVCTLPKFTRFQLYFCYRTKSKTREVKIWKLPWFYKIQMSFCSMFMRNIRLWKGPINEKTHFSYRFQGWLVTSMLWFPSTSKLLKQKQWYFFYLNAVSWPKNPSNVLRTMYTQQKALYSSLTVIREQ